MLAAWGGDEELLRILLAHGADANAVMNVSLHFTMTIASMNYE
jgi:hypothetical protein